MSTPIALAWLAAAMWVLMVFSDSAWLRFGVIYGLPLLRYKYPVPLGSYSNDLVKLQNKMDEFYKTRLFTPDSLAVFPPWSSSRTIGIVFLVSPNQKSTIKAILILPAVIAISLTFYLIAMYGSIEAAIIALFVFGASAAIEIAVIGSGLIKALQVGPNA